MAQTLSCSSSSGSSVTWPQRSSRRTIAPESHSPKSSKTTLLWIDDFAPALELYKATMETFGFKVLTASSGEAGVKLAAVNPIDLVITDYEMPGMNGETVAAAIKSISPATPVIIFSGSTLLSHRSCRNADAFCDKAGSRDRLLGTIHRLLHRKRGSLLQPPPPFEASHDERRTVA
jgi:two-component system response regulator CpxR